MNENFIYTNPDTDRKFVYYDAKSYSHNIIDDYYILKFAKINDKAIIPTKRYEDAGYDIYTVDDEILLNPGETYAFHTGIKSEFCAAWVGIVKERGSTAKYGLSIRSGVIDSGYRGEWLIMITNVSKDTIWFTKNDKYQKVDSRVIYPLSKAIAQVIFLPVPQLNVEEVNITDLSDSERGEGKFGSSGK